MAGGRSFFVGLVRRVSLLGVFVAASAIILAAGAFVLVERLSATVRQQAIDSEVASANVFASAVISPLLVHGDRLVVATAGAGRSGRATRSPLRGPVSRWSARNGRTYPAARAGYLS